MPNFNEQPNFDLKVPTLPNYNIGWLHRFNEALQALVNRTRYLYENGTGASVEVVDNLETADPEKALSANMGVAIAQAIADVITELGLKAPLDSPNFTGDPAAPTQTQGTNNDYLATTQFVNDAVYNGISALISNAPENLNQLNELATALNNDPNFATTVLNAVAKKLAFDVVQVLTTEQKNNVFGSLGLQAGATAQDTDGLSEGALNKYFTNARVLASLLAGLVTTDASVVAASDSVIVALGKLQKQATDLAARQSYDRDSFAYGSYIFQDFLGDSQFAPYVITASSLSTSNRYDSNELGMEDSLGVYRARKVSPSDSSAALFIRASNGSDFKSAYKLSNNKLDTCVAFSTNSWLSGDTTGGIALGFGNRGGNAPNFIPEFDDYVWLSLTTSELRINCRAGGLSSFNNTLVPFGVIANKRNVLRLVIENGVATAYLNNDNGANVFSVSVNANLPPYVGNNVFFWQPFLGAGNAIMNVDFIDLLVKKQNQRTLS